MRFSLTSLIRLSALLFLSSSAAAVGLSRLAPPPKGWRVSTPASHIGINNYYFNMSSRQMKWIDLKNGDSAMLPIPEGEGLDSASRSPWTDETGNAQIVGRWMKWGKDDGVEVGIARVGFPGGEVIDRVITDVVPIGPPCWSPGTMAKVIYAAADGGLYRYAFESTEPGRRSFEERPIALEWRCPVPGRGRVMVGDPFRSTDPMLSDYLFVSMRTVEKERSKNRFSNAKLWWLRLSSDGRSIDETGPLRTGRLSPEAREINERAPSVGKLADGGFALAYLRQPDDQPAELRIALLHLDSRTRRPVLDEEQARTVAENCAPAQPIFSADGRSVCAVGFDAMLKTAVVPYFDREPVRTQAVVLHP